MDEETKKFFEELSNTSAKLHQEQEMEVELAKSTSSPVLEKVEEVNEESEDEVFDEGEGQLTIDVYQSPDEIIIESPIAGVRPEDLDIDITNESVTIRGSRERERRVKEEDYFYQECYWGKFSRSVVLPQEVDAEKASANIKNGVLTIKLPKLNRQKAKKLRVKFD